MTEINKLDLKGFCFNSIRGVFHTMLSMEVSLVEVRSFNGIIGQ